MDNELDLFAGFQQAFLVGWAPVAIFIMATAGFALLYAGMVRKKNVSHTILTINVGWTLAFVMYFLIGFPLAYYTDAPVIGIPKFFPTIANPLPPALAGTGAYGIAASPSGFGDLALWFKMSMFAITAVAIVPGALAERDNFWGWVIAAGVISAFIYPIVEHWVWGGGWLSSLGFIDYAGSTVVHLLGGTLALTGAIIIGPRIGKFVGKNNLARSFFGHSIPLSVIGAWLLVFGWFGFNIGSSTATDPQTINVELSWVSVTTAMAMAGGLFGAAITSRGHVLTSMIGLLAGAVAICSGAAVMGPIFAFITGLVAGLLTTFTVGLLENVLKIDDALACFPVHGACGIWGALATGLFGAKVLGGHPIYGFETADWLSQIGVQALGALSIMLFTAAAGFLLFFILNKFGMLRVLKDAELYGIDIAMHKTYAYPEDMIENQFQ
ncbi:MAG: ammonium transporter [Anaerolineae bacterium]|jgi:Amt family ammonium transporter